MKRAPILPLLSFCLVIFHSVLTIRLFFKQRNEETHAHDAIQLGHIQECQKCDCNENFEAQIYEKQKISTIFNGNFDPTPDHFFYFNEAVSMLN